MLWKLADQCSAINVNNEYIQWKNPLACSARGMGLWKKVSAAYLFLQGHMSENGKRTTKVQQRAAYSQTLSMTYTDDDDDLTPDRRK